MNDPANCRTYAAFCAEFDLLSPPSEDPRFAQSVLEAPRVKAVRPPPRQDDDDDVEVHLSSEATTNGGRLSWVRRGATCLSEPPRSLADDLEPPAMRVDNYIVDDALEADEEPLGADDSDLHAPPPGVAPCRHEGFGCRSRLSLRKAAVPWTKTPSSRTRARATASNANYDAVARR